MPPPSRPASRLPPMGSFQVPSQPLLERPLNVTDALGYLDAVKVQFHDQPDVYNHFLDIMKDFKSGLIDTPGVIKRVSHLFNGHPDLIQGFNTFLPVGYRIECSSDPQQSSFITVTTPTGTMLQSTRDDSWPSAPIAPPPAVLAEPDANMYGSLDSSSIEPAVQYVQKIKQRCDEATYRRFLEILGKYHNTTDAVDEREVSAEIARLFKDDPDLRADFRIFMPEKSQALFDEAEESYITAPTGRRTRSNTPLDGKPVRRRTDPQPLIEPSVPQKRKRKANERDTVSAAPKAPSKPPLPPSLLPPDDTHFFDRVKRALGNRDTYNEFLKLVNLFTQELIDTARLVREARNFLGDAELMRQFREILGWDDRRERERWVLEESQQQQTWARAQGQGGSMVVPIRPGRVSAGLQLGSYRRMPASEANVTCAGRDEMCRAVLNDEWVSHPTWSSEDAGFIAHKKNIYEEALHRSEEERHEYDFHVEAATRTIAILEPLAAKIAQLPLEERSAFKLKPNLGGSGKAVHARVIKKIYGREAGLDVLQAMQDAPALAIPVVLMRLKEKEEEWKRAQREWNKVWREVDARNASRALDHAGIACKAADKKALSAKALVAQIEAARDAQVSQRAALVDPLFARARVRHQLAYEVADTGVLQDAVKMALSFLDRTQGQIGAPERRRIEGFLRTFIPLFFVLDQEVFHRAFVLGEAGEVEMGDDGDDGETGSVAGGNGGKKRKGGLGSGGDLRKKLLKSEQAKLTGRKTRAQEAASPSSSRPTSRPASPAIPDAMQVDAVEEGEREPVVPLRKASRKNVFFGNTVFYVLLRLLEVLYSRLLFFKKLSARIAIETPKSASKAKSLDDRAAHADHFYDLMLESCERLFDNEIEQYVFEEQMRYMFGVKDAYRIFTIDKVIGSLIKQVQIVLADSRSQELFELLKRDRALQVPTIQDQLNSRRFAENLLGPDENIFRIDWLPDTKTMTIQLLGKDDSRIDDSEMLAERWQAYVDSFVSSPITEGISQSRVGRPFLRKNIPPSATASTPAVLARSALETKVCVRTYRLFFVSGTEDFLWRIPSKADLVTCGREEARRERWIMKAKAGEWNPDLTKSVKEPTPVQAGKEQIPVSVTVSEPEPARAV
ncbi:uncharacterized protein F5891DRAFT_964831 [Suillus fuscotomentosus]|uniref:Histone deacetylase interacting domain-containing protein n=1 Tax=Suillus fuscotomentosus TaxID=1912939 RepID=A0AAD4HD52_9AGAM|nr:uncharacterized protein F5891DRAFT_964831 [Suillus fuscotomentosus]KAG1890523.1 hypothetical protein F5891DRAFT_964831 [Suillus fuscotomentosus]